MIIFPSACPTTSGRPIGCSNNCGGKASGCYCDNACYSYSDCCRDACDHCYCLPGQVDVTRACHLCSGYPCGTGRYFNGKSCLNCPSGRYGSRNDHTACDIPGTYNFQFCFACPAGRKGPNTGYTSSTCGGNCDTV